MQVTLTINPDQLREAIRAELTGNFHDIVRDIVRDYIREAGEDIAIAVFESAAWDDAKEAAIDGDDIAEKVIYKLSGKSLTITID